VDKKTVGVIVGIAAVVWLFSDPTAAGDVVGTGIRSVFQAVEAMLKAASPS